MWNRFRTIGFQFLRRSGAAYPGLLPLALLLANLLGERAGQTSAADVAKSQKPNILLIVADDLGWADVGWHGSKFKTPNLDRLCREGIELDRHYVQPVCSPTRTALLSGRWTSRFGPQAQHPTNLRVFPAGTTTLASALKSQGYATCMAGKWHLGSKPEWGPSRYGFDHSYGSLNGAVDPWTHQYRKGPWQQTWHRDGKLLEEEGNATELVAREIVGHLKSLPEPFFAYVPFHAVHIPVDAPDEYKKPFADSEFDSDPAKNESLRRMAAFVAQMDAKVGDFVRTLDETGRRERTLIVFTSDNGGLLKGGNPYVGNVPPTPALSSNLPLRGQKAQLYEGGVRVAAFVHWKGTLAPRKMAVPMHAADWTPTLTHLAGREPTEADRFDGRDIWPLVTGETTTLEARPIYIPQNSRRAILYDEWKLIETDADKTGPAKVELFHLKVDPYEENDLAKQESERVMKLQAMLGELRRDDLTELPKDLEGIHD